MEMIGQLVEELREALDGAELTEMKSDHWPYKVKKRLGPGPRGGKNKRADDWECTCGSYKCTCKGISPETKGQKKTVLIGKEYKKTYNAEYKAWAKKHKKKKKKGKKD